MIEYLELKWEGDNEHAISSDGEKEKVFSCLVLKKDDWPG